MNRKILALILPIVVVAIAYGLANIWSEQQMSKLKPIHLTTAPKPSYHIEFDLNSARGFEVENNGTPKLILKQNNRGKIDLIISHTPYF